MYTPQTDDLKHTLDHVSGFTGLAEEGVFPELSGDLIDAILTEAGKFSAEVIAPLNRDGDVHGCKFDEKAHTVATAPGWQEAYRQWVEAGWGALPCEAEFGGQGLPISVGLAAQELWNTACSAFGIGSLLTQGAVEALVDHASAELKATYLEKMSSGDWTGTMNLTEPQAGSDLAAVKSKAERAEDGTYRITGTKIYITYGEHDLTENIIHLVLARLPDAPEGTRGISMFLVPKYLVNEDGSVGERNDVKCIGMEHKLGIHGSPTCTLRFGDEDGAVGWLVGEENRGLNCMFTMMNNARLHVGMQGVAVAERAYQQALAYARERRQGRKSGNGEMVQIIEHPDVRRMLLDMRSKTEAARSICYQTALALDLARYGRDEAERDFNDKQAALLTPVTKSFGTEIGCEVASIGIQVHGGMGFIEETGAAQHLRDARITPIYEGTNGIQAIDLITRKLSLDGGEILETYLDRIDDLCAELQKLNHPDAGAIAESLASALGDLREASQWMTAKLKSEPEHALASATPYSKLFGMVSGAYGLAKGALGAHRAENPEKLKITRYFCDNTLIETGGICAKVKFSSPSVLAFSPAEMSG